MNPVRMPITRFAARNQFRADWQYRRTPAGDEMLAVGKGLSPAFFALLAAIEAERAISFRELDLLFTRLDADDLELWLAELCRMRLIAPAQDVAGQAGAPAQAAHASHASHTVHASHAIHTSHTTHAVRVLLVHREPATRHAWRTLLAGLPVELIDAESLESAEAAYNQLQPQAVILGPGSGDFNTLNLLHVLKHPRAPRRVKALLMLDISPARACLAEASARADETVPAAEWHTLAGRLGRQLGLAAQAGAPVAPSAPAAAPAAAPAPAEIAPAGGWKHKPLDTLYNELLAICAELEAREAPAPLSMAA